MTKSHLQLKSDELQIDDVIDWMQNYYVVREEADCHPAFSGAAQVCLSEGADLTRFLTASAWYRFEEGHLHTVVSRGRPIPLYPGAQIDRIEGKVGP